MEHRHIRGSHDLPDGQGPRLPARHANIDMFKHSWSPSAKIALTVALLLVVALAWVGGRAWLVKEHLQQAEGLITVVRGQASDGDYAAIPGTFDQMHQQTTKARALTVDPLWEVSERLPVMGPNLKALRGLTEVVDDTMVASEPLVALAPAFAPAGLAPKDGKVPLDPFIHAADVLPPFAEQFPSLRAQLAAVPTDGAVAQLQDAKAKLLEVFDKASAPLDQAVPIVKVLPALLGADGPRTYVVMFQNNAELRSLGGTALSFTEITVDGGAIKLTRAVPAGFANFPEHVEPIIPVPDGFDAIQRVGLGTFIADATYRPSSMTAAKIIQAEWRLNYGKSADGVISMDGPALSNLLAAVGPVTLSTGDVVSSTNVVELLFNEVYQRYNSGNAGADNLQQNVVYDETVSKTFAKLTSGDFDPKTLLSSMSSAAQANNFSVWLANPAEQAVLEATSFGATGLPEGTATADVVGMYLNDQVGSKLNYYLDSTVTSSSAMCTTDGRQVHRVSLALTSTLDPTAVPGLSPSISGGYYTGYGLAKGEQRLAVFAYLPKDSTLLSASVDGTPVGATGQADEGHPVQVLWITIPPGATGTLSVDVLMGAPSDHALEVDVTPTLKGTTHTTAPLDCGTVSLP